MLDVNIKFIFWEDVPYLPTDFKYSQALKMPRIKELH